MKTCSKISWILILLTSSCFGGVIATTPLSVLLDHADSVLVATVQQSQITSDGLLLDLAVLRTIKGKDIKGSVIQASWSTDASLSGDRVRNLMFKTGIWFLKQSGSTWKIWPRVVGDILIPDLHILVSSEPLPVLSEYSIDAPPQSKLVKEIEAAALNPTTANSTVIALRALDDGLGQALVQDLFSKLSLSANMPTRLAGVSGQFRSGTPHVAKTLLSLAPDSLPADAQNQLSREVCGYRSTDTEEVASLATLLGAQYSAGLRFCAAHALREIHTAQTLSVLASLFNDPMARIRYDAVIGVAQYAMGFPMTKAENKHALISNFQPGPKVTNEMRKHFPTEPKFELNEQEYISYWREWLTAQGVH